MNTIKINQQIIGKGKPKICVPITGNNKEAILNEIKNIQFYQIDIVEWRLDLFEDFYNFNHVYELLYKIKKQLPFLLLVTFRTIKEGGHAPIDKNDYFLLYQNLIKSGQIDLIDVECSFGIEFTKELVKFAHDNSVFVIASYHNFSITPSRNELLEKLKELKSTRADIVKIAVMPENYDDVYRLISTFQLKEAKKYSPKIGISMGEIGKLSRFCGELFDSCITFASIERCSAPGQLSIKQIQVLLDSIHCS